MAEADEQRSWLTLPIIPALIAAIVSLLVSVVGAWAVVTAAEGRLRQEFQLQSASESVARRLMQAPQSKLRSFAVIKYHLGGFKDDDELRQILLRAGAVRFEVANDPVEYWGLLERVADCLGEKPVPVDPNTNGIRCGPSK